MARGKKSGGKDFTPGISGNPTGRMPLPPELKEVRRLNKTEFERIANKYLWSTIAQITEAMASPEIPAFERVIVSILFKAIDEGDHAKAEWFAMRLLGKVTEKLEVKNPTPFIITRSSGAEVVLGAKIEEDDVAS